MAVGGALGAIVANQIDQCHHISPAVAALAAAGGYGIGVGIAALTGSGGTAAATSGSAGVTGAVDDVAGALADDVASVADDVAAGGGGAANTTDDLVNLASPDRTNHILYGDGPGSGGHLWPGQSGKTPFPQDWSPGRVMHEVSDIATDPSIPWVPQTGNGGLFTRAGLPARFTADGVRGGINVRVIVEPAGEGIITAFPRF
jgi:filamentous hemagglutinin